MNGRVAKYVLTDACFWMGLYNRRDPNHVNSISIMKKIEKFHILLPWPILYEVLNTKFLKNKIWLQEFDKSLKTLSVTLVEDGDYREKARIETVTLSSRGKRIISLVDMVVRFMIQEGKLRIHYLITYNVKDFYDVCKKRKIPIIFNGI